MLDTVLEIGKVLRAAPDGLKFHRYIKKGPVYDEKRNPVVFWRVPVALDGTFDFAQHELLTDENRQKRLFYLNYKSSDADSTKPYIYGDVYRSVTKIGEDGNFRFGDANKKSWMALNSFQRAEGTDAIPTNRVKNFRNSFRKQLGEIETFLRANSNSYIHFDFDGEGWQDLTEELELLNQSLLKSFFQETQHGYVMSAFLYKTLAPGSSRTSGFQSGNEYKSRIFTTQDEAMDLLYGINYSSRAAVRKNDVKIVVLPRGENLKAEQIEHFFERAASAEPDDKAEGGEEELQRDVQPEAAEELFAFLTQDDQQTRNILQFDFVFSKAGGTQADTDLIELSGLDRSKLSYLSERVREKQKQTEEERQTFFLRLFGKPPSKEYRKFTVMSALLSLLSNKTRNEKKYQSHLLHVLPQIYTGSYFQDPVLLPAFIEKTEFNLRNDQPPSFNLLKFEFYFLTRIQNSERDYLMDIRSSRSYQVGLLLGKLAKQFSGPNSPIKSFEKNYVGLLSRRITTIPDVVKLANEINQKLVIHELSKFTFRTSNELSEELKGFSGRYDKNECAFGFFESYFAPLPKSTEGSIAHE